MRFRFLGTGAAVSVAVVLALGGCAASTTGKAGTSTAVLRLASIDAVNDNGQSYGPQAFIDTLRRVSGGKVKIELDTDYGDGAVGAERDLVKAIGAGRLDGGWPATRAFAAAGVGHFRAVEAPFTVASYAGEKALVSSPVGTQLLSTLDGSDLLGLGLAVGPLRRPFASKQALQSPEDWQGRRFRVFGSPVQADVVRALGGQPVDAGIDWLDRARDGQLDGGEADIAQYAELGQTDPVNQVTANVVLWPKVFVLTLNRKRYESLTSQQQQWVRQAAQAATAASVNATYDETTPAQKLCSAGVRFNVATDVQLAALRAKVRPVLDSLAADPAEGPLLQAIQRAAGGQTDEIRLPDGCRAAQPGALGQIPEGRSAIPDGVYRAQITATDLAAAGLSDQGHPQGIWTLTVTDGEYRLTCRPHDAPEVQCGEGPADTPLEAGELRGSGQTAYFVYDVGLLARLTGCRLPPSQSDPEHCAVLSPFSMTWAMVGDQLTFTDFRGDIPPDPQYLIKPWTKVA